MEKNTRSLFQKAWVIKESEGYKIAIMNQRDLDPTCWLVQFWGVDYCKSCEFLGTKECGGSKEVKDYFRKKLCTVRR
jgi:hypothetical protein